jgi:hypothetical protein
MKPVAAACGVGIGLLLVVYVAASAAAVENLAHTRSGTVRGAGVGPTNVRRLARPGQWRPM